MRVIARRTLREFWGVHPGAEASLKSWYFEVSRVTWRTSADVKARYPSASILNRERVVFNIRGNEYRLIVRVNYAFQIVHIRFIGTHAAYDRIDPETV